MIGEIGILNVGAGDTKITFDPTRPDDMKKAAKVVTDMIKRGYAVLVHVGEHVHEGKSEPIYRRAHAFDEKTFEYIVAGTPEDEEKQDGRSAAAEGTPAVGRYRGGAKPSARRIAASRARGVAVGRTAGG